MQNIAAITQCTNRKRATISCVSRNDLPLNLSLNSTADLWVEVIASAEPTKRVTESYCGRGFTEFCKAVGALDKPQ